MKLPTWLSSMQWHSSSMCKYDYRWLMCGTAHQHEAADGAGMIMMRTHSEKRGRSGGCLGHV